MRQAEAIARRRGHPALTRQILLRLERGQIKHPDADALQGVAAIYDVPYPEIAAKFFAANYGSDLIRPGSLVEQEGNKTDAGGVLIEPASLPVSPEVTDADVAALDPFQHAIVELLELADLADQLADDVRRIAARDLTALSARLDDAYVSEPDAVAGPESSPHRQPVHRPHKKAAGKRRR